MATVHYAAPFTLEEMTAGLIETTGLDAATVTEWMSALWAPDTIQARAGVLGGSLADQSVLNTRAWRAAEFPAANMFADARSLARMYAATVSEVDGVRLLTPETVKTMTVVHTDKTKMDGLPVGLELPANRTFYMSLGFWRSCPPMPWVGPGSFGHPGSGGSVAFGDFNSGVGFGYVTNLWSFRVGEPRAQNLADAVVACLG